MPLPPGLAPLCCSGEVSGLPLPPLWRKVRPAFQSCEGQGQFCTALEHLYGPRQLPQTRDIPMVSGGNRNHGHRQRCLPLHGHRPGHDPHGQHGLRLHHGLRWLLATHNRLFHPSFTSPVPSLFIRLTLFRFSFSPVCHHTLVHCSGSHYRWASG